MSQEPLGRSALSSGTDTEVIVPESDSAFVARIRFNLTHPDMKVMRRMSGQPLEISVADIERLCVIAERALKGRKWL